jgi:hypothetical protein
VGPRIIEIELRVKDVDASRRFYADLIAGDLERSGR